MKKLLKNTKYILFSAAVCALVLYGILGYERAQIPDSFTVIAGETTALLEENHIDAAAFENGEHQVDLKLFGLLPLKEISVDVVDRKMLIPCGMPVGIYIETDGVLVIDVIDITDMNGNVSSPGASILQKGDYILAVNGETIADKTELTEKISASGGENVTLKIRRNGEVSEVKIRPVQTAANEYKAGIWVRDNTQGVGMMTYLTPEGDFAALGHGIHDTDTNTLLQMSRGILYQADIAGIVKGRTDAPGELVGSIFYGGNTRIGTIEKNTESGIYGSCGSILASQLTPMQIGYKQDVRVGPAKIISSIQGSVEEYDIKILAVYLNSRSDNKGFIIKVTDPDLIELTGGIVQGMSGSPIVQDGKLIGAVTHVMVNDPTRGYGIFIENMIDAGQ